MDTGGGSGKKERKKESKRMKKIEQLQGKISCPSMTDLREEFTLCSCALLLGGLPRLEDAKQRDVVGLQNGETLTSRVGLITPVDTTRTWHDKR
jgi:hypothetical protein